MGLFNRKKEVAPVVEERKVSLGGLLYNQTSSYSNSLAMKLSAVYCATNQISNSVAMLPIDIVNYDQDEKRPINHPLWKILNLSPDEKYNHYNVFKMAIESVILEGDGYLYIERDKELNVTALHYLNADFVEPIFDKGKVKYLVQGFPAAVDSNDMIHLWQHIDENFHGLSVLRYAYKALGNAADATNTAGKFFRGGASLSGVLKASATLTNEQKRQIRDSWNDAFGEKGNGVAVIPQGIDFQSVSVNPKDAQLLEAMEWFGVDEIARFFNISPIRLFKLDEVSYSSMESTNLAYLQDTILPYCVMIEEEFNRKLFKPSEVGRLGVHFNFSRAIQTNRKDQADYYRTLLTNGIMSLNEIRGEMGLERLDQEGADSHYMQLSYSTIENIAKGLTLKQQEQDPVNKYVDNKKQGND